MRPKPEADRAARSIDRFVESDHAGTTGQRAGRKTVEMEAVGGPGIQINDRSRGVWPTGQNEAQSISTLEIQNDEIRDSWAVPVVRIRRLVGIGNLGKGVDVFYRCPFGFGRADDAYKDGYILRSVQSHDVIFLRDLDHVPVAFEWNKVSARGLCSVVARACLSHYGRLFGRSNGEIPPS
jgi:hypothetical protein